MGEQVAAGLKLNRVKRVYVSAYLVSKAHSVTTASLIQFEKQLLMSKLNTVIFTNCALTLLRVP